MEKTNDDVICRLASIPFMNCTDGSKRKRFKMQYRYLLKRVLANTNYVIVGWQNSKNYVSCYIRDSYTNRLFYICVPDILIDNNSWIDNISYSTADRIYQVPMSYRNRCSLKNLVESLDSLNYFYNKGVNLMATHYLA